ncbi:MAG: hypothetical protein K2Y05_06025 [Hyphomicrobiaceae bacterium]|nr:hypothetical protein [Hyphomicrobiaceae bacterium]
MTVAPELEQKGPQRRLRGVAVVIATFGLLAGLPMLTPALNWFKFGSVPAGYVVVAHGIAFLFLMWAAVVVWTSRHDG